MKDIFNISLGFLCCDQKLQKKTNNNNINNNNCNNKKMNGLILGVMPGFKFNVKVWFLKYILNCRVYKKYKNFI